MAFYQQGFLAAALGGVLLATGLKVAGQEVSVGDTSAAVLEKLGEPRGYMKSGDREQFLYDRGWVKLRGGIVTEVDLISADEAEAQRVERERLLTRTREELAERRRRLLEEGLKEKERTLSDPQFLSAAAAAQVDYWERFRERYPDVPVDAAYCAALARRQEELERSALELRVADLERRLAEAEVRAAAAERLAADAQRQNRTYVYSTWWPAYDDRDDRRRHRHSATGGSHRVSGPPPTVPTNRPPAPAPPSPRASIWTSEGEDFTLQPCRTPSLSLPPARPSPTVCPPMRCRQDGTLVHWRPDSSP
jgi:hypothetical protein